jgi:hypothetical protein
VDEEVTDKGSLGRGVLVAGGVNLAALIIGIVTLMGGVGIVIIMGFGLLQTLWLLPFYLKFSHKGESETCKGILLGGGLTVLLSVACWSKFNLSNMH